ncbi:MAG: hypothetical protein ACF8XB_13755 [Planctomycetota bacterium JB042]
MRILRSFGAALAALSVAVGCSTVEEATSLDLPVSPGHVNLADGTTVEGSVKATDAEQIVFLAAGETELRTLRKDQVDPISWYLARSSDASLTAADRLDLARGAIEDGLFDAAELEMARVVELDASLEEEALLTLEQGRESYAGQLTRESDRALASGDRAVARRLAGRVLTEFPETEAATSAHGLVERLHADIGEPEPIVEGDAEGLRLVSTSQSDRRLSDAEKYLKRAEKRNLTALQKSGSAARQSFEKAIKDYEKAIGLLDHVIDDGESSVQQRLRAQQARETAVDAAVDAYVDLSSFYMHRGSYPQSREIAEAALELAPTSERAKEMAARAEFVSAEAGRVKKLGRQTGRKLRYDPASG